MKRKKISIFVLLTIVLLLSSCDVTTMFETMRGNTYEDIFGVYLVGDQVNETVTTVSKSSTPILQDAGDPENDFDLEDDKTIEKPQGVTLPKLDKTTEGEDLHPEKVAVKDGKIPTLPKQTKEDKTELKSAVASSLSGSSKKDFVEKLKAPATPEKALAAHNTSVMVNSLLGELEDKADDSDDVKELKGKVRELTSGLKLKLPAQPTEADILNVQMASNLVNSLTSTLNKIAGAGGNVADIDPDKVDMDDKNIRDGLLEVVSDAAFMVNVSRAQGTNSELVNSIDLDGLLGMLGD